MSLPFLEEVENCATALAGHRAAILFNVKFYTEKCGFDIVSMEMDGNVKVARFVLEK